jgi:predicted nucleic acid-binding protein
MTMRSARLAMIQTVPATMIAGTALRRALVMVTSNGDELPRIHGLILEDWRAE